MIPVLSPPELILLVELVYVRTVGDRVTCYVPSCDVSRADHAGVTIRGDRACDGTGVCIADDIIGQAGGGPGGSMAKPAVNSADTAVCTIRSRQPGAFCNPRDERVRVSPSVRAVRTRESIFPGSFLRLSLCLSGRSTNR